ncbi:MAG TPA: Toxic cation resistance protein, partial [Thermoplasmata archaeon]|nr:Toxic cation resistance protein [Thermoplasmata archaeon]
MAKDAERAEATKAPEPSEEGGAPRAKATPSRASEGPTERKSDARRRTRAPAPEPTTEAPAEPKKSAEKP